MQDTIVASFQQKVMEQLDRLVHLVGRVPDDGLTFRPHANAMTVQRLLGHLLECTAGFCAALHALRPDVLSHLKALEGLPVNHDCDRDSAIARLREYETALDSAFRQLRAEDLEQVVPTVLVAEGLSGTTLLLNNLEHLVNHKYQLFLTLKLHGVPLETRDLYHFVGD